MRTSLPLLALGFGLVAQPAPAGQVPFPMQELVTFPLWPRARFMFGDADRDGFAEVYIYGDHLYAVEHVSGAVFDSFPLAAMTGVYWDLGDPDFDGKADILGSDNLRGRAQLHEARTPAALPDSLVWESGPGPTHSGYRCRFTDLDVDSAGEVVYRHESRDVLLLYENIGDNLYELKDTIDSGEGVIFLNLCQTHDLDRDGLPELAVACWYGNLILYEAAGNDSLVRKAKHFLGEPSGICSAVAAAQDMDRDGRPEVIAMQVAQEDIGTICVFESPVDDSFEVVWSGQCPASYWAAAWRAAAGDVDGDSAWEFAVTTGWEVRLYTARGNDRYELAWSAPTSSRAVGLYDIDSDGRCELFYQIDDSTRVMKYCDSAAAVAETSWPSPGSIPSPLPTHIRAGPIVLPDGQEAEVYDPSGRRMTNDRFLKPGVYIVRPHGNQAIVRKVLVLR